MIVWFRTKKLMGYSFLMFSVLIMFSGLVMGYVQVNPTDNFGVGSDTFSIIGTMYFNRIDIADGFIGFNSTYFNITSTSPVWVKLSYLDENINGLVNRETALRFSATASSGDVIFSISGFTPSDYYLVYRDSSIMSTLTSNSSGVISFSNSLWSTHVFTICQSIQSDIVSGLNATDFIDSPFVTVFKVFTDLFGFGFFLIPISVIGAALWRQKKDPFLVTIYFVSSFAILGGASIFGGFVEIAPLYIILTAMGITALIIQFLFMKK